MFGKKLISVMRWLTLTVVGISCLGLLPSVPIFLAVWQNNITDLLYSRIHVGILYDAVKAIWFLGSFASVALVAYNVIWYHNAWNRRLWALLIGFYVFCAFTFFMPFDVNRGVAEDLSVVGLFMIMLAILSFVNLVLAAKPIELKV